MSCNDPQRHAIIGKLMYCRLSPKCTAKCTESHTKIQRNSRS